MNKLFLGAIGGGLIVVGVAVFIAGARNPAPQVAKKLDTTKPSVHISGLSEGQSVSCSVTIQPNATDNVAVQKVAYYIDGAQTYVSYDMPYTADISFKGIDSGPHDVKAVAYDAAGNSSAQTVNLQVNCTIAKDTPKTVPSVKTTTPSTAKTTTKKSSSTTESTGTNNPADPTPDTPAAPPDTQAPTAPANLTVSYDTNAHFDELHWDAATDDRAVTTYAIYRDGQQVATSTQTHYFDMRISKGKRYSYEVYALDAAANASLASNQVGVQLPGLTVWGDTVPGSTDTAGGNFEVGTRFSPRVAGKASGVRFYKTSGDTGTHTGHLWSNTGDQQLATVTFSNESSSGWQVAYFSTPVNLTPGTLYMVSMFTTSGDVAYDLHFFNQSHFNDQLISYETAGVNFSGAFKNGGGFPDQKPGSEAGYGVDIAFSLDTPAVQAPITTTWSDAYKQWSNGPEFTTTSTYPVSIWGQWAGRTQNGTANGTNFQDLGILQDVGLYGWPVDNPDLQLTSVATTNWRAFVTPASNEELTQLNNITILQNDPNKNYVDGYILVDEPDMNQVNLGPGSYLAPLQIEAYGQAVKAADPTRPRYVNFGKPFAIDLWGGFQSSYIQTGSIESDLTHYCNAADIASADYYGHTDPYETASYHGAWTYGKVIDNMRKYCGQDKLVWGFVENGKPFSTADDKPTPDEMEAAVWNMVVHGANGIIYFAQQFYGGFIEDAFLYDAPMRARVGAVNARLQSLATQLNTKSTLYMAAGKTNTSGIPLDTMVKQTGGSTYIFAQAGGSNSMPNSGAVSGTISVNTTATSADVVGESRTVPITNGRIVDNFAAYGMHVYKF